jgi:putative transcriptional regulator
MKKKNMDNKVIAQEVKLDLSILKKAEKYSVDFQDIDNFIDSTRVKFIREKMNMSQSFFARLLGVSKKTIEKWEQGYNPIKGTSSRLLYVMEKHPEIIDDLYHEQYSKNGYVYKDNRIPNGVFNISAKRIDTNDQHKKLTECTNLTCINQMLVA